MNLNLKRVLFNLLINSTLFFTLFIGIQNSNRTSRINFINKESIELPISFIIGISFIFGSVTGGILPLNKVWKKND